MAIYNDDNFRVNHIHIQLNQINFEAGYQAQITTKDTNNSKT